MGVPPWRQGFEMPEFSGKSWNDLNDVWPIDKRVSSDVWYIMSVFQPAFHRLKPFLSELLGIRINDHKSKTARNIFGYTELTMLAWCLRCEEAKGGLCTEEIAFSKGLNQGMPAFWRGKAGITKMGLIENIPTGTYSKAYRVTEKGRMVLRRFVELIDECHEKLKTDWAVDRPPYDKVKPIDKFIRRMTGDPEPKEIKEEDKPFEIND